MRFSSDASTPVRHVRQTSRIKGSHTQVDTHAENSWRQRTDMLAKDTTACHHPSEHIKRSARTRTPCETDIADAYTHMCACASSACRATRSLLCAKTRAWQHTSHSGLNTAQRQLVRRQRASRLPPCLPGMAPPATGAAVDCTSFADIARQSTDAIQIAKPAERTTPKGSHTRTQT